MADVSLATVPDGVLCCIIISTWFHYFMAKNWDGNFTLYILGYKICILWGNNIFATKFSMPMRFWIFFTEMN